MVDDVSHLVYLVNLNSLEVHVPQWTVTGDGERENPNRLVIDLDPGSPAGLKECARVALLLRERLDALGLEALSRDERLQGHAGSMPRSVATSRATRCATSPSAWRRR